MKTEILHSAETATATSAHFSFRMVSAIYDLRDRLVQKYEQTFPDRAHLVRKAIAEAEAMAWQTSFPHLLFPDLAETRVAELAEARQFADAA
jgi:hypothetical protein